MASDETQIQIFADWPILHAKRVTKDRPVGRGGAMGAPASPPPPQTAEVHFFVKKINTKKK